MNNLPTIPDETKQNLPPFLRQIIANYDDPQTQDVILLTSIATLSSAFPNVSINIRGIINSINTYFFLIGNAAAGKSRILPCLELVDPIHNQRESDYFKAEAIYQQKLAAYNKEVKKNPDAVPPVPPVRQILFQPANTTDNCITQNINENPEGLLIFETEASTLVSHLTKKDLNNYKSTLTKTAVNEPVSYSFKTSAEYVRKKHTRVAAVLSSYPSTLHDIFDNEVNDGFFSRFLFYKLPVSEVYTDETLDMQETDYGSIFQEYGKQFFDYYNTVLRDDSRKYRVFINQEQLNLHNALFHKLKDDYAITEDCYLFSSYRRLTLHIRRIASVLTMLRLMPDFNALLSPDLPLIQDKDKTFIRLTCTTQDYLVALSIGETLFHYTAYALTFVIPGCNQSNPMANPVANPAFSSKSSKKTNRKITDAQQILYDALPNTPFTIDQVDVTINTLLDTDKTMTRQSLQRKFKSLINNNHITYNHDTNIYSK